MGREILFRAKHIHVLPENEHLDGQWIEGYLSDKNYINSSESKGEFLIDENTICQYTGLKDQNGKKIYEGDIVSYRDGYFSESGFVESDCVGKVVWDNDEVCYHVTGRLSVESYEVLTDCYVIGNVFDNPELMD